MQHKSLTLAILLAFSASGVLADETSPFKFSGSGFLTVAAGKIIGEGDKRDVAGWDCPCFVSDYAQGGVYEDGKTSLKPDSKLGLQGTMKVGKDFSLTGQGVFRGARDGKANLEWVYAGYDVSRKFTVQVGRKRLPLLYYSESQDVGVTYPWAHLPPQVYGWEIVNYNGANLLYRDQFGSWSSTANVFAGSETHKDNGYWKIYNGKKSKTNAKWDKIAGAEWVLSKDWFETRIGYIQSFYQNQTTHDADGAAVIDDENAGTSTAWSEKTEKQKIYALSFSVEHDHLVAKADYLYMNREVVNEHDISKMIGVGYRFGKWLPFISWADYQFGIPNPVGDEWGEGHAVTSFVLRYDLTPTSDVKLQFDRWKDHSNPNYRSELPYGNSKLLTVAYDMVF